MWKTWNYVHDRVFRKGITKDCDNVKHYFRDFYEIENFFFFQVYRVPRLRVERNGRLTTGGKRVW